MGGRRHDLVASLLGHLDLDAHSHGDAVRRNAVLLELRPLARLTCDHDEGPEEVIVVGASLVLAYVLALEEKAMWRWAWDAVSSGFTDTSRYWIDWRAFLSVLACGVGVARWMACAGRERRV